MQIQSRDLSKLIKRKTIYVLSYVNVLSDISTGISFLVFGGCIVEGWRRKSIGGVVRTYVLYTPFMYILPNIRDIPETFPIIGILYVRTYVHWSGNQKRWFLGWEYVSSASRSISRQYWPLLSVLYKKSRILSFRTFLVNFRTAGIYDVAVILS